MQYRRVLSDSSGTMVDNPYMVSVVFDGKVYTVALDRYDLEAELQNLSLYHAIARGEISIEVPEAGPSLISELHARVRKWALAQGLEVGQRGAVRSELLDAYRESGGLSPIPEFIDDREVIAE